MPTSLSARLVVAGGQLFNGTLKDHCPGGVFVEFDSATLGRFQELLGEPSGVDTVALQFQASHDDAVSFVEIPTRVARVQGSGVGMAFDDAAPDVLAVLASAAAAAASPAPAAQPPLRKPVMTASERIKLTSAIRETVQDFFERCLTELFKRAEELLFVGARDAPNNTEQQACFDSMKELESLEPPVTSVFVEEIRRQIDGLAEGRSPSTALEESEYKGLELVDTGSFDDWLTMKAIIDRSEKKSGKEEENLARRVSAAFGIDVDADTNPVGVRAACFAFHDAVQHLGAGKRTRNVVLAGFEECLVNELSALHTRFDSMLPEAVAPAPEVVRVRASSAVALPPAATQVSWADDDASDSVNPGGHTTSGIGAVGWSGQRPGQAWASNRQLSGQSAAKSRLPKSQVGGGVGPGTVQDSVPVPAWPQGGTAPPNSFDTGDGEIALPAAQGSHLHQGENGTLGGAHGRGHGAELGSPNGSGANQGQGEMPEPSDGEPQLDALQAGDWRAVADAMPAEARNLFRDDRGSVPLGQFSQAWRAARNLSALRRQLIGQLSPVGADTTSLAESPAHASDHTILDKLDSLGRSSQIDFAARGGGSNFREQVRQAVGLDDFTPGTAAGDALDVVAALLDALLGDVLISGDAKERIGQLAMPLLRTAFTEESFLASADHPAREVVDRIGRLDLQGSGPVAGTPAAVTVDALVGEIVERHIREPDVFSQVLPTLDEMVACQEADYRQSLAQLVAAREKQESVINSLRKDVDSTAADQPLASSPGSVVDLPEEWRDQLLVAESMPLGQVVTLDPGTSREQVASLAWRATDNSQFLFADVRGNKAATFSLQEFAMGLRRGNVALADDAAMGPVERGMYRMLHDMHQAVAHESTHDSLTGLPNAKQFREALEDALKAARRTGVCFVACYVDVDCVDEVTDRCGQNAADKLAIQIARLLEKHMGNRGLVSRITARRYGLLYRDAVVVEVEPLLERLRAAVETARCVFGTEAISLSISVAVVPLSQAGVELTSIVETLAALASDAQAEGGNRVLVAAENTFGEASQEWVEAGPELADLLADNRLVLRSQLVKPVAKPNQSKPYFEVLLGRYDDEGEIQSAGKLFQTADKETAKSVDQWVVTNTLEWMQSNRRAMGKLGGMAINLSPDVIGDPSMLDFVVDEFTRTEVPPGKVVFELAESSAVEQLTVVQEFMRSLREFGCRFSLDDFRAGQASFAYLKNLPVDRVKIDGALIQDIAVGDQECAMVRSVNEIAHFMGKETIAELVDDPAILDKLVDLGVDHAQGYCIHRPIPLDDLAEKLEGDTAF